VRPGLPAIARLRTSIPQARHSRPKEEFHVKGASTGDRVITLLVAPLQTSPTPAEQIKQRHLVGRP
jgi:hypothetical protein